MIKTLFRAVLSLCLGLWLVFGTAGLSHAATAIPFQAPPQDGSIILAAGGSPLSEVSEIARMDTQHLLFLGAGVVGGALFIAPNLGVSELIGVALGLVVSEYTYRNYAKPRIWPW